jgi:hypothetical protein
VSGGMTKIRKLLIGLAALLILMLLGALFAAYLRDSRRPLQSIQLKDGRVVELLAVTEGPAHSLPQNRLRQIIHGLSPVSLKRAFGPYFSATFGFNSGGLGLWLMCYDPTTDAYVTGITKVIALDEHGCEFESGSNGQTSDGFHSATICNLSTYPRRLKEFKVRLIDSGAAPRAVVGELTVQNPAFANTFPTWTPENFPVTKTNGPAAVRMNAFDAVNGQTVQILGFNGRHHDTHFEDSTGNSGTFLCTNEPAWRYCTTVFRMAAGPFATNEVWKVGDITVPAAGKIASLKGTRELSGRSITVKHLAGPGSYSFSNDVCIAVNSWKPGMSASLDTSTAYDTSGGRYTATSFGSADPFVVVEHPHLGDDVEFLLLLRDQKRVVATAHGASGANKNWYYPLAWIVPPNEKPADGTTLKMEIVIHKGYKFEFLVNPLHHFRRGMPR